MNGFLKKLERHLELLEESERNKICEEYRHEIKLKIASGMSEEEAIQSYGSVSSLAKKIYAQYHINGNAISKKKTFASKVNEKIESCAVFLADTVRDVRKYSKQFTKDRPLETFFEILLKILLLVILFALLKIPVFLLEELMDTALNFFFYPFQSTFSLLSHIVVEVIYLIVCVCISVNLFQGYSSSRHPVEKKEQVELPKEEMKKRKKEKNYAIMFIKVIFSILFVVPLVLLALIFLLMTLFSCFLVYKGVAVCGLIVASLGYFFLTVLAIIYLINALENKSVSHKILFGITIIIFVVGHVLVVDDFMNFEYPKTLEESHFDKTVDNEMMTIERDTYVMNTSNLDHVSFEEDREMLDNQIRVSISYYDMLYDFEITRNQDENSDYIILLVHSKDLQMSDVSDMYQDALADLQNHQIFDYNQLEDIHLTVYGNSKTLEMLKK